MLTKKQYDDGAKFVVSEFEKAGIKITEEEKGRIEVADFGLGMVEEVGLQLLVYVNTEKVCAKEMVLRPYQTCPQHIHINGVENGVPYDGKEETFRVRKGVCYLYVSGEGRKEDIKAKLPPTPVDVFHEVVLHEGEQYTLYPCTQHWFQAGPEGAIVSEFSTHSRDESDIFLDERISRIPEVEE
ncbi:MAG: D-lyxose/D-mannose family sugar isomerase [Clostridia bacterium]|nr:D-lyxose/D-mannose family sugar isomerase [Clostridia bacterium]